MEYPVHFEGITEVSVDILLSGLRVGRGGIREPGIGNGIGAGIRANLFGAGKFFSLIKFSFKEFRVIFLDRKFNA